MEEFKSDYELFVRTTVEEKEFDIEFLYDTWMFVENLVLFVYSATWMLL